VSSLSLPLQERATDGDSFDLVRLSLVESENSAWVVKALIPTRELEAGEQYRFHFDMTKCIGCRSCEVACNEQNGNPAEINWRRVGELEGGTYPDTIRHYLSMGCNHCLDADCVKGCPVEAYTKDPVTGIVLHSADACIGCQYCVWNCPYSVPQFNAERGVVGKCDMCQGRLATGLEPACVNACPEHAIEIEIVNRFEWKANFAAADSPGMPAARHTVSTTRITLPADVAAGTLERVDTGQIRPEHPHWSLVFMTTMVQGVVGTLAAMLLMHALETVSLTLLALIAAVALNISVFHLGRPAYAWRALKMWRRSWLSREVLLFGLFFLTIGLATVLAWTQTFGLLGIAPLVPLVGWLATGFGVLGILASAYIYLVPARPSWNLSHTPIDFVISAALLGSLLAPVLEKLATWLSVFLPHAFGHMPVQYPVWPAALFAVLWILNQLIRLTRLRQSSLFEGRACFALLRGAGMRDAVVLCLVLGAATAVFGGGGVWYAGLFCAVGAVLVARYLFFVSVVPLSMGLTFLRERHV
jgi:formate dehydrogenase iron-sulfur subunit